MRKTLVTGGTGSVGRVLVEYLLTNEDQEVFVFSRDETKQHDMRIDLPNRHLHFQIGDIRDPKAIAEAVRGMDTVLHCAAMKHVPSCEKAPFEAVQTNIVGTQNLIRAVVADGRVGVVVAISTDKACKPVGVMGHTKAIMERLIVRASLSKQCDTNFIVVRFGNVVPSRGSVFPYFQKLVKEGKPLTVTSKYMTRFLLPIGEVPVLVLSTARFAEGGEIWVPVLRSAYIEDIAKVLRGDRNNPIVFTGIRLGEKLHELLVSEEEAPRTRWQPALDDLGECLIIQPSEVPLPTMPLQEEYSSRYCTLTPGELRPLLEEALGEL